MAKLKADDGRPFAEKYQGQRAVALHGFELLLDYDEVDRRERGKAGLFTASDDKAGGTAFDCLRGLVPEM